MSGKYEKKTNQKRKPSKALWTALILAVAILAMILSVQSCGTDSGKTDVTPATGTVEDAQIETVQEPCFTLDDNLEITKIGSYTGAYMEDGSNEVVSGVMMIVVKNNGENAVQYAEITLSNGEEEAFFTLSTLNPGESVVVLEANRKEFGEGYEAAFAEHVVYFNAPLSVQSDRLEIQPLDGGFNITNISGEDISGEIVIYYKNYVDGLYYGGITYRGRIQGGIAAGEIRQVMVSTFSADASKVMFVTISGE